MKKRQMKLIALAALFLWLACFLNTGTAGSSEQPDYKVIVGEWIRSDGNYIIRVSEVHTDGSVDAEYFNPNEINVAEANVSLWKRFVKLFIKLQDKGYPGSTYTLYYYEEKDALAGFYYQAVLDQTYEVVFTRKPNR